MHIEIREDSVVITGYVNAVERYSKPIRESLHGKIRTLTTAMTALYMACARRSDLQHWRISCMYSRVE